MIVVEYLDRNFKKKKQIFRDFEAQVIQHEIDHFSGILIWPTETDQLKETKKESAWAGSFFI